MLKIIGSGTGCYRGLHTTFPKFTYFVALVPNINFFHLRTPYYPFPAQYSDVPGKSENIIIIIIIRTLWGL